MRRAWLPLAAALIAAGAAAPPVEAADVFVRGRIGDVFIGVDTRDHDDVFAPRRFDHRHERAPERKPDIFWGPHERAWRGSEADERPLRRHLHRRPVRRHFYGVPYTNGYRSFGTYDPYFDNFAEEPAPAPPPAAAAPPGAPAPEAPERTAEPPDVRGPLWETARGRASGVGSRFAVGERLPAGVPHVALEWQDYGLPRPPAGQTYARVGGTVLLIEADSRVVRRILTPDSEG